MSSFHSIPKATHYAIITKETVYFPGDERSRTHPGHGYPAENKEFINYDVYENKEAWINKIKYLIGNSKKHGIDFFAVTVEPAQVKLDVSISVESPRG